MATSLGVAVVGAGTVGKGVVDILRDKADLLSDRSGCDIRLLRVADMDNDRLKSIGVEDDLAASSADEAMQTPGVDVVVELIGGTKAAYDVVQKSLENGKAVVTANKALLAERGAALFTLAGKQNVPLYFEAAVCGAIPIIRSIRDGLAADRLQYLLGIVNGTCNYILSQMDEQGQSYDEALAKAQELGFAEADPTFDVEGFDSAHKLALLASLGFDTQPDFARIPVEGIKNLVAEDVHMAGEMGYMVKLLAVARPRDGKLYLSVHPALLPKSHPLAGISGSMNAVSLYGDSVQEAMFSGRGAGETPTASAVVSDIVEIARAKAGGCDQIRWLPKSQNALELGAMEDYRCRFFMRFSVQDRFGVLGRIASVLGENRVSIASAIQHEKSDGPVPLVVVTHEAREGDVRKALATIDALDFTAAPTGWLRVEG